MASSAAAATPPRSAAPRQAAPRSPAPLPAAKPPAVEDFASLLDETLGRDSGFDGSVVTGRVVRLTEEFAIVDVGLKSEGRVALKEFGPPGAKPEVKPGDVIELYVERYEDRDGTIVLSREKARREEAWTSLERAFETQIRVNGTIYERGFNRVGASRLYDIGRALDMSIADFFGDAPDGKPRPAGGLRGLRESQQILDDGGDTLNRRETLDLVRAFTRIADADVRQRVLDLVRSLGPPDAS